MADLIAVNDPFTLLRLKGNDAALDTSLLKREALMFSRIYIPTLTASFLSNNLLYDQQPETIGELQWLLEQDIVRETEEVKYDDGMIWDCEQFASTLIGMRFGKEGVAALNTENIARTVMVLAGIGSRFHASNLRRQGMPDTYPVLTSLQAPPIQAGPERDVLDVLINQIPVPDEMTPWEQIVEFRSDPDSQNKFLRLKNWVNELAKMQLNLNEVEDKLRSLISDYQAQMKIHKIKTRFDTLKTIVLAEAALITGGWLTGLGALPGIAGMVAAPLYSIKQRRISLLEEEQKVPEKVIAYIVKAQETFKIK